MAKTITGVDYEGGKVVGVTISGIIDADNDQPTSAYFQRVRNGRWIASHDEFCACSICKYPVYVGWNQTNYCPNCGAKMDGERI